MKRISSTDRLYAAIGVSAKAQGRRRQVGAAIAELGPAMWVLLFGFFFPVLVLVAMLCSYGSILVLNNSQVHEAALLPSAQATDPNGAIIKTIPTDWQGSGLGKFVRLQNFPTTTVTYKAGSTDQNNVTDQYVWVTTTCQIAPLVKVPFLIGVPGLNEPMTFVVQSNCVVENPDNVGP